jgi:hypothetical protein
LRNPNNRKPDATWQNILRKAMAQKKGSFFNDDDNNNNNNNNNS